MEKPLIYDLTLPALTSFLIESGEPPYRAHQIWKGLYRNFWHSPVEFTTLPGYLRDKLAEIYEFNFITPQKFLSSSDGDTTKILFSLPDGKAIETVLMRYELTGPSAQSVNFKSSHPRNTLCISTQVGCAMGCKFCATGQMGFRRHLSNNISACA